MSRARTPPVASSGRPRKTASSSRGTRSGPPPYDAVAVGRIAQRVEILSIELVGASFDRRDANALPGAVPAELTPQIGVDSKWKLSRDRDLLGCVVTFGTIFEGAAPYNLVADFRLTYSVTADGPLRRADLEQFASWNAVFNAWPYWREYISSTLNRAQLPKFLLPVMVVSRSE